MKRKYKFPIEPEFEGYSVEDFLLYHLPQFAKATIRKMKYDQLLRVNGRETDLNYKLKTGEELHFLLPSEESSYGFTPIDLQILHEEKEFLVVNKPPGLAVIPERWSRESPFKDSIAAYCKQQGEEIAPRIVHRIDKETSGAVIVAKEPQMEKYLSKLFATRNIQKQYVALVVGKPPQEGKIELPLAQANNRSTKMVVSDTGKPAITTFKLKETFRDFSLIEVSIETGRTHQIRVHLASSGYPLAIDSIYGYRRMLKLSELKKGYRPKKGLLEKPLMSRLTLHAHKIAFALPEKNGEPVGESIVVEAPHFKDFGVMLKNLRKYRK